MEYSRNQVNPDSEVSRLSLYSEEIQTVLWGKLMLFDSIQAPTPEQLSLIKRLEKLNDTPGKLEIPPNLVLIGTLNSDETTYDLSPKVIDRAYAITYPPANLRVKTDRFINGSVITGDLHVNKIQVEVKHYIEQIQGKGELADTWQNDWGKIIDWNERYLINIINRIGIPIGHRIKREYQVFFAVAHTLGIIKENHCLGYFVFTKLLPRISFIKNGVRESLCQEWMNEIRQEYSMGGESYILDQIDDQISDTQRRNVRYWG
jgi:RNA-directed DNA polymerase